MFRSPLLSSEDRPAVPPPLFCYQKVSYKTLNYPSFSIYFIDFQLVNLVRQGFYLNLKDVNFKKRSVSAEEKGGHTHTYKISREGLAAIKDYIEKERAQDFKRWRSPALFLSPATTPHGNGRLNPKVINTAWNEVCRLAGVEGHTPHDARHAMGKHLIEKTGNLAAVQRQLGHTNPAYSMQYTRITDEELGNALEDR